MEGDGVGLSCRDRGGSGTPVVLLHGPAGHAGERDAVARALSPRRVVAAGRRGHGAMPTAAAHPHLVRAPVLVGTDPGGPDPNVQAEIGSWLGSWPAPFPSREAVVAFLGGECGRRALGRPPDWRSAAAAGGPRSDRDAIVGSPAENARHSFWDAWAGVTCPVLAALGQSGIIRPQDSGAMLRRHPGTAAVSVPGTGHDVPLERPDVLRQLRLEFLDEVAAHPAPDGPDHRTPCGPGGRPRTSAGVRQPAASARPRPVGARTPVGEFRPRLDAQA
ncbi:alpha/beta fold hydrolase [Streptomyces yaizuensis]|uniref:Alpha/beta hydrolase n=1 Tax=Streptomyces yaizuensis TaxID=2989713 RepID=A0ABQ5NZM9_9ACTN|nr:alpha/beta hydrolase [Streptomyces sp. YSPA8]GLF95692.1 alpha/beta hydrolase [Streptomyces sp. YSPA8]